MLEEIKECRLQISALIFKMNASFFFTLSFGASIGTKKGLDEVNKACHLYLLMLITLSDYVERCLEYNSQTLFHFSNF